MITVLIYDGSWLGLLTTVFEIYERRLKQVSVRPTDSFQSDAFGESIHVYADELKAKRVLEGLKKKFQRKTLENIYAAFLSEVPNIENIIVAFIRLIFSEPQAEQAYGNSIVLKISQTAKAVYREQHRMKAFVRFELTTDGIYFAKVSPDFNVLPLIKSHFQNRYADQKWLIYDLKRKYGLYYNLETVEEVGLELNPLYPKNTFCEAEEGYQSLWKQYFQTATIAERKNTKLHLRHVPRRYWKYLTEKGF